MEGGRKDDVMEKAKFMEHSMAIAPALTSIWKRKTWPMTHPSSKTSWKRGVTFLTRGKIANIERKVKNRNNLSKNRA